MRGVSSGMHSAAATATVGQSMASASKAMEAMGKVSDPAKMAAIMRQFGMENEKMDMSSEMMGDAIDDAMVRCGRNRLQLALWAPILRADMALCPGRWRGRGRSRRCCQPGTCLRTRHRAADALVHTTWAAHHLLCLCCHHAACAEPSGSSQVLDDIGVDLSGKMSAVPRSRLRQGQAAASSSGASEEDTELMRRLAALK